MLTINYYFNYFYIFLYFRINHHQIIKVIVTMMLILLKNLLQEGKNICLSIFFFFFININSLYLFLDQVKENQDLVNVYQLNLLKKMLILKMLQNLKVKLIL